MTVIWQLPDFPQCLQPGYTQSLYIQICQVPSQRPSVKAEALCLQQPCHRGAVEFVKSADNIICLVNKITATVHDVQFVTASISNNVTKLCY